MLLSDSERRCYRSVLTVLTKLVAIGCALAALESCSQKASREELAQREAGVAAFTSLESGPIKTSRDSQGEAYIKSAAVLDPAFAKWIAVNGTPDAIEPSLDIERKYVLFYMNPPRSYAVQDGTTIGQLNDVPRSVRWITFNQKTLIGPWPITIPPASAAAFDVPKTPPGPPDKFEWDAFADDAAKVRKLITPINDARTQEASQQLERIKAATATSGINWNIEVFYNQTPAAFAIPDGSIFVSQTLVDQYNGDKLCAVIAHLIGHVRYGHFSRVAFKRVSAKDVGISVLADTLIIAWDLTWVIGAFTGPGGVQVAEQAWLKPIGPSDLKKDKRTERQKALDARERDIEANYVAEKYLSAAGIAPNVLFDALMNLRTEFQLDLKQFENSNTDFTEMLYPFPYNNGVIDLGRALDAGVFPQPAASALR